MRKPSLKTRMTLIFPVAICAMITLLFFATSAYFERSIKKSITSQQYLTVSVLADEIDQKLLSTQQLLIRISKKIGEGHIASPAKALSYLREEDEFLSIFDNGLFLFDNTGRIVAELPLGIARVGKDFSFRDYLKKTFAAKGPVISAPYISSQVHHHPAVMFTAPVFGATGEIIAVLGGSIDLLKPNFLGRVDSIKIGQTGYMYMISTDRKVIIHPDKKRILSQDVPKGSNRIAEMAIAGFEGTEETTNTYGIRMLTSVRRLKSTAWILAANYPVNEAYASLVRVRTIFYAGMIPLLFFSFLVMRHFLRKMTEPLHEFTRHVEELPEKTGNERLFPYHSNGEIASLGGVFNNLITQLDSQQEEIAKRELLYRTVVEFSSDFVFWASPDRTQLYYVSPSCNRITGYHQDCFYQDPSLLNRIIHPDYREIWEEHVAAADQCDCIEALDLALVTRQGATAWVSHVCRRVYSETGEFCGVRGSFSDVSLIKESEQARLESEEKFHTLFNNAGDAIFIMDMEGRIVEANDEAVACLGYTRTELLRMKTGETQAPDCAETMPDRMKEIECNGSARFECFLVCKDRRLIQVEVNARLTEFGGRHAMMAIARDITERNQAATLLHRQNEYLLALHETTLGMMTRLDLHELLLSIINRAARLVGTEHGYIYLLNAEETEMVIQVQLGVFNTFEHYPLRFGQGMAGHVWQNGAPYHVENYRTWTGRLDGSGRDILRAVAGVPLTSHGAVVGVIGLAYIDENTFDEEKMELLGKFAQLASLALDNAYLYDAARTEVVERTKVEENLRKLSHAVEQSPVSIVITDTEGIIEYANPHFTRLTGYSLAELQGQTSRILKSGYTSQEEYRELWETILSGREWSGEFYNRKKNDDYYWEMAVISPIRDKNGVITNFIAVKEDITDRKRLESQLRHSQKMEAVGQLAGGIAHDFNNILTAIIGYVTILQMKISNDSPLLTTISQILSTAERGASLTQGLLAFSRKNVSNPSKININEVIERVEKLLQRLISEDIVLTSRLSAEPLPVMADSIQIEQVLMNLVTNARDAMPGGGTITITTNLEYLDLRFVNAQGFGEKGYYALMTVSDTGCGMDEETVKRIFEPFYTTKETGKGTGLGLSIIYGIIKKHGGYIVCNSMPGKGSDFLIYLPLTDNPNTQPVIQTDREPMQGGTGTILLAEDDGSARNLTRELLEEFGYSVLEAEDGVQAVERYREHQEAICLVLLDAVMPGMNGMDVYREIRGMKRDVRVLVCSGYDIEPIKEQQANDAKLHVMSKPFVPKELLMKIREVLEHEA